MSEHTELTTDDILERLAEHRLDWDRIRSSIAELAENHPDRKLPEHHVGPFLTISRQAGIDADTIARRVGSDLGWAVLNGEIVDLMADLFHLDPTMLHILDEAKANWVRDVVNDLLPLDVIGQDTHILHLGRVFHLAALHGEVVLVGRAANLFLPRTRGLAVRLVGERERRTEQLAERDGTDMTVARKHVTELDRRREKLVERYFGRDIEDSMLYDLVLNTTNLSVDRVVSMISSASRARDLVH